MADRQVSWQRVHHIGLGEVVAHIAEAAGRIEAVVGVVADDAARLLSPVLKRMQAEGHEGRSIRDADHTEDAAFLLQLVVIEGVRKEGGHAVRILH